MKKITLIVLFFMFLTVNTFSQLGTTGHFPTNTLNYTPSGYSSSSVLMRQGNSISDGSNEYISDIDNTDLFVNFTFDTSGKNVYVVYTNNGSDPSKSNGNIISCSFSNYSDPNRVFVGQIPNSANIAGSEIRYVFYISNGDLASAWGRIAGDGYQTSWSEGGSYFTYNPWYSSNSTTGNWSSSSTWKSGIVPNTTNKQVIIKNSNSIIIDQNVSLAKLIIRGSLTASDASARTLTISKSTSGTSTSITNNGTWNNGSGGSTVVFTGSPSSGDAIHAISGAIEFQNVTINKTGGSSNVGASFGANSSLNGTLEIGSGGFISTAPPTNFYGTGSILKFNQGSGATYDVNSGGFTWSTTQIPNNITISSGTVNLNDNRTASGDLIIESGSFLSISAGKQLTISNSFTNNGTITLKSNSTDGTATILTPASISGSGTAKVQQYLSSARNWYVSSPVTGATVPTGKTYYNYLEDGSNTGFVNPATEYWKANTEGTMLSLGSGYIAQPASATTLEFNGTLNSGTIGPLTLTRTTSATKPGFNLVGNPFPAYLNIDNLASNGDLEPTYWYRSYNSGYIFDTYNIPSALSTGLSGLSISKFIPPMQAFWLRVANGSSSATVSFSSANCGHQDNVNNKFRAPSSGTTVQKVVRLIVSNETNYDETILYSNPNALDGFDRYDSHKYTNSNIAIPEIYTQVGSEQLAINGMNLLPLNTEIPLGFKTGQSGTFKIKATEISNFDADIKVFLKDSENLINLEQELTIGSEYEFTSNVTNTEDRFSVIFKSNSGTTAINTENESSFAVYKNADNAISIKSESNENAVITIFNSLGQKIIEKPTNGNITTIKIPLNNGFYIVMISNSGKTLSKQIVLF